MAPMLRRLLPIFRKEFIHIRRDFRTLIIIFAWPALMLFMFGYAINMEIQRVDLAIADEAPSPASYALRRAFEASPYFRVFAADGSRETIETLFYEQRAHAVLIIPADFSKSRAKRFAEHIQILVDASNSNAAQLIANYITAVIAAYNARFGLLPPLQTSVAVHYNPALKSAYFFVPGLIALILIMISALLTSITVTREKETGTIEQILVSPVRPPEIIIGKVIPYIFLAFADGILILLVAHFWFEVPVRGSLVLMMAGALLYIFVGLALGLLISTRVQTQQVAMMIALTSTLLPSVFLSGFIFPLDSMPLVLQLISKIVPAKYFLQIIRGILLKGNTLTQLYMAFAVLAAMGTFLTAVAIKKFKMTL